MPHYRNGTKAKIGDVVKVNSEHNVNSTFIGPVTHIYEGTDTCNLLLAAPLQVTEADGSRIITTGSSATFNARDAEKVA